MKAELKTQWVEALRSGKYKQTRMFLRAKKEDGEFEYCVLGVLYDIICEGQWVTDGKVTDTDDKGRLQCKAEALKQHGYVECYMPANFTTATEVYDLTKLIQEEPTQVMLMNDQERKTFAEIADYIEKEINTDNG